MQQNAKISLHSRRRDVRGAYLDKRPEQFVVVNVVFDVLGAGLLLQAILGVRMKYLIKLQ